ncbi:MAG TPA: putative molybdenum carrier protein [Kofleriaceae bacterium]|nr:putative molybdenum carrier protein [Kofleriaceae bacterium]
MLVVIHSGETGVERGAHYGARTVELAVNGFMPLQGRDELGKIPVDVAAYLVPHAARSRREAQIANIELSSAVLLLVPEAEKASAFPATRWLLTEIRNLGRRHFVADPKSSTDAVAEWLWAMAKAPEPLRLFITGPRGTRWDRGETFARRLVQTLAMEKP